MSHWAEELPSRICSEPQSSSFAFLKAIPTYCRSSSKTSEPVAYSEFKSFFEVARALSCQNAPHKQPRAKSQLVVVQPPRGFTLTFQSQNPVLLNHIFRRYEVASERTTQLIWSNAPVAEKLQFGLHPLYTSPSLFSTTRKVDPYLYSWQNDSCVHLLGLSRQSC